MNPFEELKKRLAARPEIRISETATSLRIHPEKDGFEVGLWREGPDWVVSFEGWHEHFPTPEEAVECVRFGLSPSCRLKVTYRGSFAASWTVQRLEEGRFIPFGSTGYLLFPFWREAKVVYRANRIVDANSAA